MVYINNKIFLNKNGKLELFMLLFSIHKKHNISFFYTAFAINLSFCFYYSNPRKNRVRVMVFNATFNNISVISWWSVLLVEEIRVPGENH
jgi:hypothetical protein